VRYPENFFKKDEATNLVSQLYPPADSTVKVLTANRPNIIFIILESFTAGVVEPLGGQAGITPHLNQFCREGILFDNFYSSGDRTDKGLISILSGYPAQPLTSIIKYPSKTQHLPHLNHYLKKLGYKSSFIYGGDIDFANFRSYLTSGGFDHLTTMDDFPDEINESKWGVHDHYVFEQSMRELDTTSSPFFKVILTLSSHEPFDVPMEPHLPGNDEESMFLNSCYYTDQSLGKFITEARSKPWWNNTLIILTADHGHRHPGNKELKDKNRFKVPLLFMGGAVSTDTVIHTLSGHTDIPNTLLAQIDTLRSEFIFSKNILAHNVVPFAAYYFTDGYGFLLPGKFMVYDNPGRQFLETQNADEEDLNLSKAYQQMLYSDYNKR
jgi:phosphoglycerol transferase MdoB-like AlkP superfamily enzyme